MNQLSFKADLHCHSNFSDGTSSPKELVELAKERGLQALAITDHDNFHAFGSLYKSAIASGIRVISGMELSIQAFSHNFHVLAYSFDVNAPSMKEYVSLYHTRRLDRLKKMIEKLRLQQVDISLEDVLSLISGPLDLVSVGRVHLATVLVQKGYASSIKKAFDLYLKNGGSCFVPFEALDFSEALEIVHSAKGKMVLAHPHLIQPRKRLKSILELPFDGIEAYYCQMADNQNEHFLNVAKNKGLFVTGGSDFHGAAKANISLGDSWTPQETFEALEKIFKENNLYL